MPEQRSRSHVVQSHLPPWQPQSSSVLGSTSVVYSKSSLSLSVNWPGAEMRWAWSRDDGERRLISPNSRFSIFSLEKWSDLKVEKSELLHTPGRRKVVSRSPFRNAGITSRPKSRIISACSSNSPRVEYSFSCASSVPF